MEAEFCFYECDVNIGKYRYSRTLSRRSTQQMHFFLIPLAPPPTALQGSSTHPICLCSLCVCLSLNDLSQDKIIHTAVLQVVCLRCNALSRMHGPTISNQVTILNDALGLLSTQECVPAFVRAAERLRHRGADG